MKVIATARVTVTLEIDAASSWGEDSSNGQVFDQAGRETVNWLTNFLHAKEPARRIRIIGEPKVTTILTRREP